MTANNSTGKVLGLEELADLVPDGATFELTGVDKATVGTVTRTDGTKQATVGGWPVYTFSGDKKSCDINGQGLGGVWFALKGTGAKAL